MVEGHWNADPINGAQIQKLRNVLSIIQNVVVAESDRLGVASRAARKLDIGQVVVCYGQLPLVKMRRLLLLVKLKQVLPVHDPLHFGVRKQHDVLKGWNLGTLKDCAVVVDLQGGSEDLYIVRLLETFSHHEHFHLYLVQAKIELIGLKRRIHIHQNQVCSGAGHLHEGPLCVVGRVDTHSVARIQAKSHKAQGDLSSSLIQFFIGPTTEPRVNKKFDILLNTLVVGDERRAVPVLVRNAPQLLGGVLPQ